jgi:hypothetical protein
MRKFVLIGALALPLVLGTGVAQAGPLDFLAGSSVPGITSSSNGSNEAPAADATCDPQVQRTPEAQENCESKDSNSSSEDINSSTAELAGSAEGVLRLGTAVVGIAAILQNPALAPLFGLVLSGSA